MKLAKREIAFVSIGGGAVSIFLLLQFLIFPFFENRERIRRGIQITEESLREMAVLSAEYQTLQNSTQGIGDVLRKEKSVKLFLRFLSTSPIP